MPKQRLFEAHSVRKYGSLWYKSIQQMVVGGYPIYRIAQLLNVSRSLVLDHYKKKVRRKAKLILQISDYFSFLIPLNKEESKMDTMLEIYRKLKYKEDVGLSLILRR
ncbi:hypothetical protein ACFCYN_14225 [Gottfriedia sp. NPDC056225]|uniref:hypothetical protein n=1 Tax=Gottfriedia sp. NPDC056225 TaxID=3345751 RepID=UPI0035DB4E86